MNGATQLEGDALLKRARDLSGNSPDQVARACGYVGAGGRVLKKAFLRALVEAKGFPTPAVEKGGSRGRQAEYRTRVHGNGNLLIGHAYTRRLGLEPGQEFKIELHKDSGSISLLPLDQSGDSNSASNRSDEAS